MYLNFRPPAAIAFGGGRMKARLFSVEMTLHALKSLVRRIEKNTKPWKKPSVFIPPR